MQDSGESTSQVILNRLLALAIVGLWALISILIAKGKRYFRKPLALEPPAINIWQLLAVFISYFGTYLLLMPFTVRLVGKLSPRFAIGIKTEDVQTHGWLYLAATLVALLLVMVVGYVGCHQNWKAIWKGPVKECQKSAAVRQWTQNLLLGFYSWFIAFPVVNVVGQIFGLGVLLWRGPFKVEQEAIRFVKMTMSFPLLFSCTVIAVVFLIPILEELLFRGFLQSWLRKYLNAKWAIGCSALIFAVFHYTATQGLGNFELLSSLFVLACFLGYLFERQRSLWASIALHSTFNAFGLLLLILDSKS